jgi:hypothetical protein
MVPMGSYEFADPETREVTFENLQFVGHRGQQYELRFIATTAEGKNVVAGPFPVVMQACPEGTTTDPNNHDSCICSPGYGVDPDIERTIDTDGEVIEERRGRNRRLELDDAMEVAVAGIYDSNCRICPAGTYNAMSGYTMCMTCNPEEEQDGVVREGALGGGSLWTAREGATSATECKPSGCTSTTAVNYNSAVSIDDGSCIFDQHLDDDAGSVEADTTILAPASDVVDNETTDAPEAGAGVDYYGRDDTGTTTDGDGNGGADTGTNTPVQEVAAGGGAYETTTAATPGDLLQDGNSTDNDYYGTDDFYDGNDARVGDAGAVNDTVGSTAAATAVASATATATSVSPGSSNAAPDTAGDGDGDDDYYPAPAPVAIQIQQDAAAKMTTAHTTVTTAESDPDADSRAHMRLPLMPGEDVDSAIAPTDSGTVVAGSDSGAAVMSAAAAATATQQKQKPGEIRAMNTSAHWWSHLGGMVVLVSVATVVSVMVGVGTVRHYRRAQHNLTLTTSQLRETIGWCPNTMPALRPFCQQPLATPITATAL